MAELILALDLPDADQALALVDKAGKDLHWCKVGMELFTRQGPSLIKALKDRGLSVFLDLKFYDIPHTVGRAVASAQAIGADLLTLHAQGGKRMLSEAVAKARELPAPPLLFAVTVLTSFAPGEMPGIDASPEAFALDLAALSAEAGLQGIVCSPREVAAIKARFPNLLCLCPGIRPAFSAQGDQRRTATPREAVAAGADYLVVGRPILQAKDPSAAVQSILEEMA